MKLSARLRNCAQSIKRAIVASILFLAAPITFREILLFGGCALIGCGLWPVCPPAALAIPGAIIAAVSIFGVW